MSFFFHSEPNVWVSRVDVVEKYNGIIENNDPISFLTRVYRKKTFTGLLTNYFSFTSYSYKVGLIRTLIDRAY